MKQAFRLSSAAVFFALFLLGATVSLQAQTNPDPFVAQITSSAQNSYAGDMSGDGRFVVIESTGDIATEKTPDIKDANGNIIQRGRNNSDGNREIFLFDYAQRRIFQLTFTTSARVDPTKPALNSTTPTDFSNIKVEVSNNKPVISNDGRWIVFSSNATTPGNFDGDANSAALVADGNQEIFMYQIPPYSAATLSSGADAPFADLSAGTFIQVTNTAASRVPSPGTTSSAPFVAFDNRDAAVNDDGSIVAFVSTRNFNATNADANPEIFIYKRSSNAISQLTNTTGQFEFSENPTLSGNGSVVAFISNANISAGGSTNNADANGEIYLGSINTATGTGTVTRQVTKTTAPFAGIGVNFFSPGRRISRDGNLIAFESLADLSGTGANQANTTIFIYNVAANSFTQVGPRGNNSSALRFPTFTDYNNALQPATIIFATGLNFLPNGTAPTNQTDGLNPSGATQIFAAPVAAPTTFTRLTNNPGVVGPAIEPFPSNTQQRIAFSITGTDFGGLNTDLLSEAFYLLTRTGTDAASPTVSFFTGASQRPVIATSPTPPAVSTLAPGMLAIVQANVALAPSNQTADSASESAHRPSLPIELNGVSVAINGAAAGLFFVSPTQIQFVVPPGLTPTTGTATYPVVINNNGTTIRSTIQISIAQPDIFTMTDNFGTNRAAVLNVTNPLSAGSPEPFSVTTTFTNSSGQAETDPTILRIFLTGVRRITDKSQVTVTIGTTALTGTAIVQVTPSDLPGTDLIDVTLPASLAGAGDVPVVVSVANGGSTFTSRDTTTAPKIRIN